MKGRSKYNSRKVKTPDGVFDSGKEARRWVELKHMESAGEIKGLMGHVPFLLIPEQREADTIGKRGGIHKGKVIERACIYISDFVYEEKDADGNWTKVVEDCKGMRTPDYIIKRKLMLHLKGIRIRET